MNITNSFQKMGILVAKNSLIASLEKVANLPLALVEISGITKPEDLPNPRQRSFFDRYIRRWRWFFVKA